ncbi:MAG: SPASM domain-containing protein, partial [Candidatus Omnitrophica bacterium]|nr:SPASM domain-containing protein [Candidatus Omnitrophota bacterium]
EPPLNTEPLPLKMSCDWLWMAMQVNWNGEILQCCEGVIWSGPQVYATMEPQKTSLKDVWNSQAACETRRKINEEGRGSMDICSQCTRKGISFKW